jgi:lipopolysaccharide transport system permease protein
MKRHDLSSGVRGVTGHLGLLRALIARDIEARYRGTALGLTWSILSPLMMLAVYTFLFGVVFRARWQGGGGMIDFILMLHCGLITYGLFSETLMRAPGAVVSQPNFVKKVVFPLELLPLSQLGAATFNAAVGLILLLIFLVVTGHGLPWTSVLVPALVLPFVMIVAGLAWLVAALGVFFRDIAHLINLFLTMMLSLSPVFYPVSATPAIVQPLMHVNPLTFPIEELRRVLLIGDVPSLAHWAIYWAMAVVTALLGLWVFQYTRSAFADVV